MFNPDGSNLCSSPGSSGICKPYNVYAVKCTYGLGYLLGLWGICGKGDFLFV